VSAKAHRAAMDGTVYLLLDPLRVVAFNTADGWMRDVSADIARQVLTRTRELEHELPAAVRDFVERVCA